MKIIVRGTLRDRIPSRWNLSRKGIDVASITCPICDCGIETSHHTLWTCSLATMVWNHILNWLDLSPPIISDIQGFYAWLDDLHISSNKKVTLEVICGVDLWSLWNYRNETIFGTALPKHSLLLTRLLIILLDGIPLETNCLPLPGIIGLEIL